MEKRVVERFPLQLAATVRSFVNDESGSPRIDEGACIENISSRGALISSSARWVQQERVEVLVSLGRKHVPPYRYDISLAGRVVRDERAAHGERARYAVEFEKWDLINWGTCETAEATGGTS